MTARLWCARSAGAFARILLVATAVAVAAVATGSRNDASGATIAFRLGGSVSGLYPGASLPLKVKVTNHEQFAIVVTSITTTVHDASASCVAHYLTVGEFVGRLVVPASGSAAVHVPVHLSHAAGNACQGATFPLTYLGQARKA